MPINIFKTIMGSEIRVFSFSPHCHPLVFDLYHYAYRALLPISVKRTYHSSRALKFFNAREIRPNDLYRKKEINMKITFLIRNQVKDGKEKKCSVYIC